MITLVVAKMYIYIELWHRSLHRHLYHQPTQKGGWWCFLDSGEAFRRDLQILSEDDICFWHLSRFVYLHIWWRSVVLYMQQDFWILNQIFSSIPAKCAHHSKKGRELRFLFLVPSNRGLLNCFTPFNKWFKYWFTSASGLDHGYVILEQSR